MSGGGNRYSVSLPQPWVAGEMRKAGDGENLWAEHQIHAYVDACVAEKTALLVVANTSLVNAIDRIRETLCGGSAEGVLDVINQAITAYHEAMHRSDTDGVPVRT